MKKIFISLFIITVAFLNAQNIKVGSSVDEFNSYEFKTPHDKKVSVAKDTKMVIVTFEKDASNVVNEYFTKQDANFLESHKTVVISDINKMPSFVTKFFALPKLKEFKHTIHLHYEEEFQNNVPHKEESITVIKLENEKVTDISYIKTSQELDKLFN